MNMDLLIFCTQHNLQDCNTPPPLFSYQSAVDSRLQQTNHLVWMQKRGDDLLCGLQNGQIEQLTEGTEPRRLMARRRY